MVFADGWLRRGTPVEHLLFDTGYRNHAGPVAMLTGIAVSIVLFSNQVFFTGLVPAAVPQVGDIAFEVGFLVSGAVYLAMGGRARAGR